MATWFIVIWVGVLVIAVVSRSLLANIGLIMVSVAGAVLCQDIEGITETIRYYVIAAFLGVSLFGMLQIVFKVRQL